MTGFADIMPFSMRYIWFVSMCELCAYISNRIDDHLLVQSKSNELIVKGEGEDNEEGVSFGQSQESRQSK